MYNGTVTRIDQDCIESWDMDGGLKAYVVIDADSGDAPTGWGSPGSYATVEYRGFGYRADACRGSHVPDGLDDALAKWGTDWDMVDRYLRMFCGAVAIDRTDLRDGTVIGVCTADDLTEHGEIDAAGIVKDVLDNYRQWAEGEVYGVIVTNPATGAEASLWSCYDSPSGYLRTVADDLASEVQSDDADDADDDGGMFSLTVGWDNAAFADGNAGAELARILRTVADRLESGDTAGTVKDYNGNTVGKFDLS